MTDYGRILRRLEGLRPEDVRGAIDALIQERVKFRDAELRRLDRSAARILANLDQIETQKLAEELDCFREILALHRSARNHDGRD